MIMNNFSQTARVGLFFILGLALVWVSFETLSDGRIFQSKGYALVAGFKSLKGVNIGDEVRMAGVAIGSVESTRLAGHRAEAVLRIDSTVPVRTDSTATIVMSGLLGTNYIGIDLGTDGYLTLSDGSEIQTKVTADLNSVMSDISTLGQKLEGALNTITIAVNGDGTEPGLFQKINQLVSDNSESLRATIANIEKVSAKLNTSEGTIGKLLNDSSIHDELIAAVTEFKTTAGSARVLLAGAQEIVERVKGGQGSIGALVYDDQAGENIKVTMQNLRDISDKLGKGEGTIGKLLNDDSLYLSAQSTMKKANSALDSMGDSGPITAAGIVAQGLF
jgi:phospholipid/cholesterol/gamma-HCH transport system substrate-binding protein